MENKANFIYEKPKSVDYGDKEGIQDSSISEIAFSAFRRLFSGDDVMGNERKTEKIVRNAFDKNKETYPFVEIEEQKSDNKRIDKLLKLASKSGLGKGSPEFIVSFNDYPDLLIIVECKPNINKHQSATLDRYKEYAVDGVLLYSSYLSKEFDVFSIAISGEKESEAKISTFLQLKNKKYKDLDIDEIYDFESYLKLYKRDPVREKISAEELLKYSKELNNFLRDEFELEEGQRPLLVSGILIALEDDAFVTSYYKEIRAVDLAKSLTATITKILEQHKVDDKRRKDMINIYSFIENNNNIAEDLNGKRNTKLRDLITEIKNKVYAYLKDYKDHDVLGQFYNEFLRYANGDKGLGIILTPRNITELFTEIAQVNKDSVIIDNCCGTAGFLISAMGKMIENAKDNKNKIGKIHNKQLIGIENNGKMFCLASSNMLLRGDGKSNIFYNTCFTINKKPIKKLKPTIAFLNPPYSKKKEGSKELNYVLNALDFLEKNGICVAIVPIRCAIKNSPLKNKLLEKHTLEAVMSMPSDLFYPLGTVPCIMVFKAHVHHDSDSETWFGYWRDDGFIKIKNEGRVDKYGKWDRIKKTWLNDFRNKKKVAGRCVKQKVTASDEWCAEAYMETDYSDLKEEDFVKEMKRYVLYSEANK